ncbi:MAG: biotin--[Firmicutes bacterium]|nr:biotin--[acetyl-CoA-carboxylase] ligase [Bacillota bacterium]
MEYMEDINSLLKTRWLGRKYVYVPELASTNSLGYELAEKGEPMGCVIAADVQTAARGRKGRVWESPDGGLWFSLILRPAFSPQEAASLTTVTAVGLCRGLMYYPGLGAKIKWPNDIFVDGKKLGGILSEMKVDQNKLIYAVIGVGINLSSGTLSSEVASSAVGMEDVLGDGVDKKELLCHLLLGLESAYDQYFAGQKEQLFEEWKEHSMIIGKNVTVKTVSGDVKGKPVGLTDDGFLLLDMGGGRGAKVISGDLILNDEI